MFLGGSTPTLLTPFFSLFIYADPGYGTLIWQLLLAGFFGGMFYIRRVKDYLSRRKPDDAKQ
ncbi:MAG TPA: hypothetical protein VGO56_02200 [Pyrinomonadaceae bacterium]|jgi:hypothetical protein|nr:hypothetical protein [Pyrinomonadaceae bacterium]